MILPAFMLLECKTSLESEPHMCIGFMKLHSFREIICGTPFLSLMDPLRQSKSRQLTHRNICKNSANSKKSRETMGGVRSRLQDGGRHLSLVSNCGMKAPCEQGCRSIRSSSCAPYSGTNGVLSGAPSMFVHSHALLSALTNERRSGFVDSCNWEKALNSLCTPNPRLAPDRQTASPFGSRRANRAGGG